MQHQQKIHCLTFVLLLVHDELGCKVCSETIFGQAITRGQVFFFIHFFFHKHSHARPR